MPDGRLLKGIPEDTPWEEIQRAYTSMYPDTNWGEEPVTIPTVKPRLGKVTGLDEKHRDRLLKTLRDRESSDNYAQPGNSKGYIGAYQFGAEALADVGDMDLDKFKEWKAAGYPGGQKAYMADPDNWTFEGGKDAWLADSEAQDESAVRLFNNNYRYMANRKVKFKGMSPSDLSGFLMAAHLGGNFNSSALAKDPKHVFKDGNGTNIQEYFNLGKSTGEIVEAKAETKPEPEVVAAAPTPEKVPEPQFNVAQLMMEKLDDGTYQDETGSLFTVKGGKVDPYVA